MEMTRGSRQACKVRLVCVCVCVCVYSARRLFLSRGERRVGRIVSFHEMPPETGATRPSSFCCVLFGWILMRCMHACSKKDRGGRRCRARAMKHCVRVTDSWGFGSWAAARFSFAFGSHAFSEGHDGFGRRASRLEVPLPGSAARRLTR